mmetsp:Transcript_35716/g.76126  ORF Transcript_35716/g.76126 Transcript_35716/m.76126 type:complete len:232 (+) Transcript_35716:112-807(+)
MRAYSRPGQARGTIASARQPPDVAFLCTVHTQSRPTTQRLRGCLESHDIVVHRQADSKYHVHPAAACKARLHRDCADCSGYGYLKLPVAALAPCTNRHRYLLAFDAHLHRSWGPWRCAAQRRLRGCWERRFGAHSAPRCSTAPCQSATIIAAAATFVSPGAARSGAASRARAAATELSTEELPLKAMAPGTGGFGTRIRLEWCGMQRPSGHVEAGCWRSQHRRCLGRCGWT